MSFQPKHRTVDMCRVLHGHTGPNWNAQGGKVLDQQLNYVLLKKCQVLIVPQYTGCCEIVTLWNVLQREVKAKAKRKAQEAGMA